MSDFKKCVEFVLENEGGFTVDTGGATNFGITAKYLMSNKLWKYDLNKDGYIDQSDMKRFTKEDAISVYKILFENNKYNKINSDDIAMRVFDMCVNAGYVIANKMLQCCCNDMKAYDKDGRTYDVLFIDGIVGNQTIYFINKLTNPEDLISEYKIARAKYYTALSESNPGKYGKYLKGWLNRAQR